MPYVPVPKDLTKVKTKLVLGLTARQIVCFWSGGLVGIPTYLLTRGAIGNDAAAMLMISLTLPFFLFGIYEKDGQHLEQRLEHILRVRFLYPAKRPYQTENFYAALGRRDHEREDAQIEKQKTKKAGVGFKKGKAGTARRKG
ncbi:MAG: PrgI family protein [Oscillibacter sp.]|nr:PrgI family protein [Oscillibacter sp.]